MLPKLDSTLFDFSTWRSGSIPEMFDVLNREKSLIANGALLRKYAVGWCPAEQLMCRPKLGCVAVMFQLHDCVFWTHITQREFEEIFGY